MSEEINREISYAFEKLKFNELVSFFEKTKYVPNETHTFKLKSLTSKYVCQKFYQVLKENGFNFNLGSGILLLDASYSLQSKNVDFLLKNINGESLRKRAINMSLIGFFDYSLNELNQKKEKVNSVFKTFGENLNQEELKDFLLYIKPKLEQKSKNEDLYKTLLSLQILLVTEVLENKIENKKEIKKTVKI